ncbi:MAG: DUF4249 domain-containing protein [Bacteroidaceae bacterium]|nr:DUF4249 domain-containing protein [Bacteroidaceae bacterium]
MSAFRIRHLLCLFLCVLSVSCLDEDDTAAEPQLVVEGWIEDGGYPVVMLGLSKPVDGDRMDFDDYVVRWGKVTVSDGTRSVVLTGGYDRNFFPPYKYTSYELVGEAGKTYTLTAEYDGRTATAVTTIPPPVRLETLRLERSASDTLFYVKAFFEDPADERNYYGLFSRREGKDKMFLLSFLGVFSDEVASGRVAADVYCGTSLDTELEPDASKYFKSGDRVRVRLCNMDRASYRFWKSYSEVRNFSSNMFFPSTEELESNICGGKGYWCGYGSSTLTIDVR